MYRNLLLYVFLCFSGTPLFSQLSSTDAGFKDYTLYPGTTSQDLIFTFPFSDQGFPAGILRASAPGDSASCTFTWTRYNILSKHFDIPVFTDTAVNHSTITDLTQGGYQVHITKEGKVDTLFRAWVYFRRLTGSLLKTTEGKVPDYKYTCEYLDLSGTIKFDSLTYFKPDTGIVLYYYLKPVIKWSYFNEKEGLVATDYSRLPLRISKPPAWDTRYIMQVTDSSHASDVDTVLYESIQTQAIFSIHARDKQDILDNYGIWRELRKSPESAPLQVEFMNASVNGVEYQWSFSKEGFPDFPRPALVTTTDTATRPQFTYYLPHGYVPVLYSKSAEGCVDSISSKDSIIISPSRIRVPNLVNIHSPSPEDRVFRIMRKNEDGVSKIDLFASIQNIHVQIFSRTGRLVHEYTGDINNWEGWNGTMKGTGLEASAGVYYYVIEAWGYDGVDYKGDRKMVVNGQQVTSHFTGFFYILK